MTSTSAGASPAADDRPATFRTVFAVAEFRVLFGGFALFMVGEAMKVLALSVLVYERTGSAVLSAFAYVAGFLPYALGGTFLLALADRCRPRALMVGYDLVRFAAFVVLALGVLAPTGMLITVFALGLFGPVAGAARMALLPELLAGDGYVLGRSLFTVVTGGAQVFGFAVGGLLLELVGPYGALWSTAASCGVSALLAWFRIAERPARVVRPAVSGPGPKVDPNPGTIAETWRVNRTLLADRRIRGLLLAQWLPGSLLIGAEGVVVPYAAALGAPGGAGVLLVGVASGMLVGNLVVGRALSPGRRERLTPFLALLLGLPMPLFLARPGLLPAAILLGLAAAGFGYQLGLARRFLRAVPADRQGQALGLVGTGLMTAQGLAAAVAGGLGEWLDPATVMAAAGLSSLVATSVLWRWLRPER